MIIVINKVIRLQSYMSSQLFDNQYHLKETQTKVQTVKCAGTYRKAELVKNRFLGDLKKWQGQKMFTVERSTQLKLRRQ